MTTTSSPARSAGSSGTSSAGRAGFLNRQLSRYPESGPRSMYLGITVLATVVLYYELYIAGAVATKIIAEYHMTFTYFVFVSVIGNLVGAFASLFAGLADRWGRANLVVGGLLLTGLIIAFGLPNAANKTVYTVLFAILSLVEGIVLVATPALIRDFSPQVGRGTAMGFWTLGPVLGSLVVTEVSSHTLTSHPDWRWQFYVCGISGLVVFVIALFGLRELSPALRDQLMVTMRDRALIEARAQGLDTEQALKGHWRQMMRFDIIGSAFAISVFLLLYYILVGFTVVYFATVFGYTPAKANALANWYWIANALSLVVTGLLTDRFRVRKPFMIIGSVISIIGAVLFALAATKPDTSYYTFATYFILGSVGGGMAYVAWMASFTETVEKHNPAATATGLAVWGWIIRIVVTVSLAIFTLVVPAASVLVDKATPIATMQATHPTEFKIITTVNPADVAAVQANPTSPPPAALASVISSTAKAEGASAADIKGMTDVITNGELGAAAVLQADAPTAAALQANPLDPVAGKKAVIDIATALKVDPATATTLLQGIPAALPAINNVQKYGADLKKAGETFTPEQISYLKANGADVAKAAEENPKQWQHWWWVCVAGQLVFLPFVFVMSGRWSPKKAREDELEHERLVQEEMAALEKSRA